ncbi:hypothetical protein [Paraburkholderia domus]|uniref:hypothetical protein n=1 Tax=Paraburkholderia domus TaxID=2793075 RepID=UPI0019142180|nr:hypothetical protein [Paraburkholderia domus]MBK5064854.1 hypothetical protein [Burkholderia sp. R-70199]CAE6967649.1 hypothetical protein R70199_07868 [Paraburkholderia domus]
MKINGRYGRFTVPKEQRQNYRKTYERQLGIARQKTAERAAWLNKHQTCADGCGRPVAFYDEIRYALRFMGCCSAECDASMKARHEAALKAVDDAETRER